VRCSRTSLKLKLTGEAVLLHLEVPELVLQHYGDGVGIALDAVVGMVTPDDPS